MIDLLKPLHIYQLQLENILALAHLDMQLIFVKVNTGHILRESNHQHAV